MMGSLRGTEAEAPSVLADPCSFSTSSRWGSHDSTCQPFAISSPSENSEWLGSRDMALTLEAVGSVATLSAAATLELLSTPAKASSSPSSSSGRSKEFRVDVIPPEVAFAAALPAAALAAAAAEPAAAAAEPAAAAADFAELSKPPRPRLTAAALAEELSSSAVASSDAGSGVERLDAWASLGPSPSSPFPSPSMSSKSLLSLLKAPNMFLFRRCAQCKLVPRQELTAKRASLRATLGEPSWPNCEA
mmetsp:Transcript_10760/g.18255  ORF Transcript_10760/g.18255 Transcript_10760/m.18255 type:complete len:247 (+) Transcript_10760:542-1282(+)